MKKKVKQDTSRNHPEGADQELNPKRDFSEVIGSLSEEEAEEIEKEVRRQRRIDSELWKE